MKKLLSILLLLLFAVSIYYSILSNTETRTAEKPGYASIIPIPPPEPPARRGC